MTYFPRFTALQLVDNDLELMNKMCDPAQFQGRLIFMSIFNDIIWGTPDNEKECIVNVTRVSLIAKKNHSRTLVIPRIWIKKKNGILLVLTVHKENGTKSLNR